MPGLLRTSQQNPFSLSGSNNRETVNFMDSYRPHLNLHSDYPDEDEEEPEDEEDEDEEQDDQEVHNHELSELLDRILYGQQRPIPGTTGIDSARPRDIIRDNAQSRLSNQYTTATRNDTYSNRLRAREPFIRFGDDQPITEPVSRFGQVSTLLDEEPGEHPARTRPQQ